MFLTAAQSANIKAVLSSRPLSAFEASFTSSPTLRLHDLTKHDIEIFVGDQLGKHPRIVELAQDNETGVDALISEIVSAASGVFFWVKLAVDSLLEGFRNFDELTDLHQRLKAIPRDLEDFFLRMLGQIPTEYKVQSSRMFQLVRCTEEQYQGMGLRRGLGHVTAMAMYFAEFNLDKVLKAPLEPLSHLVRERRNKEIDGRLRSRCCGLLELRYLSDHTKTGELVENPHQDPAVQYLHRSVADWLQKKHVWAQVVEATKGTDYNPYDAAVKACVMRLKCLPHQAEDQTRTNDLLEPQWKLVDAIMSFARASEKTTWKPQDQILDEMDRVMSSYYENACQQAAISQQPLYPTDSETWCDTIQEDYNRPVPWCDTFLAFAIRHGLQHYVQTKIKSNGGLLPNKKGRPLLDYACRPEPGYSEWNTAINPAIVRCLLEHGADPNEKFNGCE